MRPVKVSGGELISIHALREEGDILLQAGRKAK